MSQKTNREAWLTKACEMLIKEFDIIPKGPWRITCGFPSKGGLGNRSRTLGETWYSKCSADETIEIVISMTLEDPIEVLATAAHELVHAALPAFVGHRKPFSQKVREIGLVGKPTQTTAGPEFVEAVKFILEELGPYPHAKITARRGYKKQNTYLLKALCEECGYLVRITKKWYEYAPPKCPVHDTEMVLD